MRENNGLRTDEGIETVIASIDTVQAYTPHPPIVHACRSLRALLRLRGILARLRNSRAVFLKQLLAAFFRSRNGQPETKPSNKLSEIRWPPLDVATNAPFALDENARSVFVPNGFCCKVVINFRGN